MENLIKKLQEEAGLTEDQANKAVGVVKNFMDAEGVDIDWNNFFKGKYEDLSDKAKSLYDSVSGQASEYTDKVSDKFDELASKAKKSAHDLSQKAADFFDGK